MKVDQSEPATSIQTFLIADVRGYTRFTQERGDEAAAMLAGRFAHVTREEVERLDGSIVELRGDEALAVFRSARGAVRAALALQQRYGEETRADPNLPLAVGIGMDVGEALPVEGGFRGGALNLAARLCNIAAPGEILASDAVVHLSRRMSGVRYAERSPQRLKGFEAPVRPIAVSAEREVDVSDDGEAVTPSRRALPVGGFLGAMPAEQLVGRSEAMAVARVALDAARAGTGRFVLIAGEPGIGKTRLAQEIAVEAHRDDFVLAAGSASEQRQVVPFFPFLDALAALYAASPAWVVEQVRSRWSIIGRLLPDLGIVPPPSTVTGQEDHVRLVRAVTDFVRAVSTTAPVAMMLDDLQWADEASIDLLESLVRATRADRVLLVGTYRNSNVDRDHPLTRALVDLGTQDLVDIIPLQRMDERETEDLMEAVLGGDAELGTLARTVYERTEGNPFFVREVLRALVERGDLFQRDGTWIGRTVDRHDVPERIRAVVEQRLSHLDAQSQEVLRVASVFGTTFTFEDVIGLTRLPEDDVERALKEILRTGVVHEDGEEQYVFEHGLTRAVLYHGLSPRRRKRLHIAAAELIERGSQKDKRVHDLAWHYLQGDDAVRGIPYAVAAGDRAQQVYAYADAERLYRSALQAQSDLQVAERSTDVLIKLGHVLKILGRYDEAQEALERAARLAVDAEDWESERRAVAGIALVMARQERWDGGVARLQPLFDHAVEPSTSWVEVHITLAGLLGRADKPEESLHAAEKAVDLARRLEDQQLLGEAELCRCQALAVAGRLEDARAALERVLGQIEEGSPRSSIDALNSIGEMIRSAGDFRQSLEYHRRAQRIAERIGDVDAIAWSARLVVDTLIYTGEWEVVEHHIEHATERATGLGAPWVSDVLRAYASPIYVHRGEWVKVADILARARQLAQREGDDKLHAVVDRSLSELALVQLDADGARRHAEDALRRDDPGHVEANLALLAQAELMAGSTERAEAEVARAIANAKTRWSRPAFARLLWVRGMIRACEGQDLHASNLFSGSLALAKSFSWPFLEARILLEWAALSGGWSSDEGEARLHAARAIFERLGARPWFDRTDPEGRHATALEGPGVRT